LKSTRASYSQHSVFASSFTPRNCLRNTGTPPPPGSPQSTSSVLSTPRISFTPQHNELAPSFTQPLTYYTTKYKVPGPTSTNSKNVSFEYHKRLLFKSTPTTVSISRPSTKSCDSETTTHKSGTTSSLNSQHVSHSIPSTNTTSRNNQQHAPPQANSNNPHNRRHSHLRRCPR
jgi:hypothetical protein